MDSVRKVVNIVSGRDATESIASRESSPTCDEQWAEMIQTARVHGLGPLLLRQMQRSAIGPADRRLLACLYEARNESAVHYVLAARARDEVQRVLCDADVACIWLKGIVLAESAYDSPELRPMVDIDVLVPYAKRERALKAVETLGFTLASPQLFDGREAIKHHYYLASARFEPVKLELHFRLLGTMDRKLTVDQHAWFWHHTEEIEAASAARFTTLLPEAHLLYLCAHALLQHGEADLRLLRLFDVDRLLVATPEFDWDLLLDGAVRMRWTYVVERTLALTSEYFGAAIPDGIIEACRSRRPKDEDMRRALSRSASLTTTEVVVQDLAALSWFDRIRATGRIVFPPPNYMLWRYSLDSKRELPAAYLRRFRHICHDVYHSMRTKALRSQ